MNKLKIFTGVARGLLSVVSYSLALKYAPDEYLPYMYVMGIVWILILSLDMWLWLKR